jgi:hypothetical protein
MLLKKKSPHPADKSFEIQFLFLGVMSNIDKPSDNKPHIQENHPSAEIKQG